MRHAPALTIVLAVALLLAPARPASAQTSNEEVNAIFADYFADVRQQPTPAGRADASDPAGGNALPFLVWYSVPQLRAEIILALENQRVGKQVGAPVLASGTTSLVAKGDTPSVIGLALEHGLVTGTKSGNTVTIRGNLMGVIDAARRYGVPATPETRTVAAFLKRFSFSGSFQPGNPSDSDEPAALDESDRLTAWTARFDVLNRRDPREQLRGRQWTALFDTRGQTLAGDTATAFRLLQAEPAYGSWLNETRMAAQTTADAMLDEVLFERLAAFQEIPVSDTTRDAMHAAATSYQNYLQAREALVAGAATAPVVSLEYTNGRPADQPATSNWRVIAEGGVLAGALTANLSLTAFDGDRPAGTGRLRDLQAALQYDIPLRQLSTAAAPVMISLAFRAQWLREDAVVEDVIFPGTSGTVAVGQLKIIVPVAGSPVRVPIAFTVANRSELVKERFVRGQVGVTFDVDSLLAGARAGLGAVLAPR